MRFSRPEQITLVLQHPRDLIGRDGQNRRFSREGYTLADEPLSGWSGWIHSCQRATRRWCSNSSEVPRHF